jgi:hypothetical protein
MAKPRKLPRPFTMPWGNGMVVEEVGLETEHNELVIQLLEYDDPSIEPAVRFCQYWLDGRFQRQPMMIGVADLARMRQAVQTSPRLRELLAALVDG